MKVKTLKAHNNGHGAKFAKEVGDEYVIPDAGAKPLIARGFVEEVKPDTKAPATAKAKKTADPAGDGE